jgi:hypothetical protein
MDIFAWWGYNFCPNLELTKKILISKKKKKRTWLNLAHGKGQTKGKGVRFKRRYSSFEVFMEISNIFVERLKGARKVS